MKCFIFFNKDRDHRFQQFRLKHLIEKGCNYFCLPESFNKNISHQLFDYTITFVNSQHLNTSSKGDFVLKNMFKRSLKVFWHTIVYYDVGYYSIDFIRVIIM